MLMKKMKVPEQQCNAGLKFSKNELASKKQLFCKGINHVDLMTPTIKNVALYNLKQDLKDWEDRDIFRVKDSLRYEVKDLSGCPSKLFDADDISIQQVAMNADGTIKDWVAVIKLNTDEGGYLKSEMPKCEDADYLPYTQLKTKVYEEKGSGSCCKGSRDKDKCREGCLKPFRSGLLDKELQVRGTWYTFDPLKNRRRNLLSRGGQGNCRL